MNKKRFIPLAILFLIVSAIVVTAGLYLADALPEKLTYSIDRMISRIESIKNNDSSPVDSPDIRFVGAQSAALPTDSYAVTIDFAKDLNTAADGTATYGDLVYETQGYFNLFTNVHADTIYITPDYAGKYDGFTDAYGTAVDVLRDYITYSDASGLFKVLVLNDDAIYKNDGFSFEKAEYYLNNYSFNAVLLSGDSLKNGKTLSSAVDYFGKNITENYSGIAFGADLPSSASAKYAEADVIAVLSKGLLSFAVVEGSAMKDAALPFASVISSWNALAASYPNVRFYCRHRNDLVCSNNAEWSNYTEICDQVRFLWDCENFYGSIFHNASAIKRNKNTSSVRLAYLVYDGAYKDLAVSSINVDKDTGSVSFTGTATVGRKVLCNRVPLSSSGAFSYTARLHAGENTFRFFSCGKELTYRIYNNTEIIHSYYPQKDLSIKNGETVYITAVCLDSAKVVCTVNGVSYDMAKSYTLESGDIPDGYRLFSCGVKFSGAETDDLLLGNVIITASVNDISETATAGSITVTTGESNGFFGTIGDIFSGGDQSEIVPERVSYSEGVSPYHDNGLGTALLCRIVNDDTEQIGLLGEKDTYHADASTLPAGTIDYLDSMELSDTGYLRFKLKSGMTVYGVNCELINNGYVLPQNKIAVDHVDDSSDRSTDIYFNMDWFAPVTLKCKPQKYSSGYSGYSFNISSFTAEYVELKFHYAGEFYNSALLQFAENSVFTNAELYKEGENNLILRLYLKRAGQFYGFDLRRNEQGQLIVSFKRHANGSLQGKVIMLDPGHGGLSMTGTALTDNTIAEKTVTLAIALKAKQMLESKGATVLMTRMADCTLSLDDRAKILCANNPDIFVSIHCDGTENEADAGTHSFYFRPYSQPLANAINASLANVYKTHIYAPTDTNYSKVDKSIKFYPFFVTRMNDCPAVLVETGFLTNPVEGSILAEDNAQYWLAFGISNGIEQYFSSNH